ncbi:AraC family transcriptional regulator [Vibrio casei]|uniref:AraC family transcriptional regulator n=1 Tax=Vibrio casei TaxID=673372 RepID=A0A368LPG9_9VIBR|nr:AraC family transcriptional regulator [Vibrio casei]RCS73656.1 AraC family transcriptional regulator [Vibrio casei]SJN16535.1 Transcriptional regulator, AraC family [Vibrio casei]
MNKFNQCRVNTAHFTRIEKVLEYIHQHLFLALSLEDIAQKSCWSRWQLQRVFVAETGVNVAQYIREIKLSRAAEALLDSHSERVLDIALSFGFNSEISFSRSFKQFFGCSPREYRKRGIRTGLRQPITSSVDDKLEAKLVENTPHFTQIRIEHKDAFSLLGHRGEISGLFSAQPDFQKSVPQIWREFEMLRSLLQGGVHRLNQPRRYGVIDTLTVHADRLTYWAAEDVDSTPNSNSNSNNENSQLSFISIPTQEYAVLPHRGPIEGLKPKLEWFFTRWLPQSGYSGIDGFELEIYSENYQTNSQEAYMEYWLPIE